jgi:hypothetical protein
MVTYRLRDLYQFFSLILLTGFIVVSLCGVEVKEYQFWGLSG